MHKRKVNTLAWCAVRGDQWPVTSRLKISPGSHSAITSNGRQQISQSVVKRCDARLVSMTSSKRWPQNGHWMVPVRSIKKHRLPEISAKAILFSDYKAGAGLRLERSNWLESAQPKRYKARFVCMKTILKTLLGLTLVGISTRLPAQIVAKPPLPSAESVLRRVVENSEKENDNDRLFGQRYSYTRTKVTEYRDSKGELRKRELKKSANNPAVVSVANPAQPVMSKPESSRDATRSDAVTDTHSNVRGKAFEKRDFTLNDDLLSRFQFTLAGREMLNGRPMLILEFKPANKKLPERHIKDEFINKAAGRLWVDEADYVLAKADVHLTETVNVVGGLVGAVWKFIYTFSRERLPDGLWFTRDVDWHLEGREIIVRRSVEYHERKTGVRKVW